MSEQGFDQVPINRFLGYTLLASSESGAEISMPVRAEYVQETGVVQGGILTALADTAAVYALWPYRPPDTAMTGIELKLNFLRPATPAAGELRAVSRVIQRGRKIAFCQVEVRQRDALVAYGTFTYLFFPATSPRP